MKQEGGAGILLQCVQGNVPASCGRQSNAPPPPRDVQVLISGVRLHGKGEFRLQRKIMVENKMKLRAANQWNLKWGDFLGLHRWAPCNRECS